MNDRHYVEIMQRMIKTFQFHPTAFRRSRVGDCVLCVWVWLSTVSYAMRRRWHCRRGISAAAIKRFWHDFRFQTDLGICL